MVRLNGLSALPYKDMQYLISIDYLYMAVNYAIFNKKIVVIIGINSGKTYLNNY